jgi:hypothetical protein
MPDRRAVLQPSVDDISRSFDFFHDSGAAIELRVLNSDRGTISGYFDDRDKFVSAASALAFRGPGSYITINPADVNLLGRAYNHVMFHAKLTTADAHIVRRRFALIDFDAVRIAGISASNAEHSFAIERLENTMSFLRSEGFPDGASGDSGNGGHALYYLDLPNNDHSRQLLQNFLKALARRMDDDRVKIDQAVFNASRISKLYGTPVRKGDDLPDRPHRLSRWLKIPEKLQPIPIELLEAFAKTAAEPHRPITNGSSPPRKPPENAPKFDLDNFIARHNIGTRPPEPYDGGRIFRLLCCVFNAEHKDRDAAIIERADGTLCYNCFHSSCSSRTWRDVRELYEGPRPRDNGAPPSGTSSSSPPTPSPSTASPQPPPPSTPSPPPSAAPPPPPSPPPPSTPPPLSPPPPSSASTNGAGVSSLSVIDAGDYQLRCIAAESLIALQAANQAALASGRDDRALFTRGGQIVEIVKLGNRTLILDATESMVRRRLSLAADYVKYTRDGARGVPPPAELPRAVMDTHPGEGWGLLPVDAVVEVPTFRPDGTILDREGYDSATRLYYAPGPGLKNIRVPLFPSREEIRAAVELLKEMLIDFPFVDEASRSNVVAALLTLFVRRLIRGCVPALALDATTQGSGKTLIAKIISLILTGQEAVLHAAPSEPEEWRKKLTAILRYGPGLMVFDNIVHPLSSDALSCALTSGVYADRILGVSNTIEMPVRCLTILTGNNIRAVADMVRRLIWARQDPQTPLPENRSGFKHPDLEKWVLANRTGLIEGILTVIRAWFAAGQPKADIRRGSFDDWAQTVGGILENAGIDHFLENRSASYATDADVSEFGAFLLEIREVLPDPFLTIELVKILANPVVTYDKVREALPDWMREKQRDEGQFCAFLGNVFSKRLDKRNSPSGVYVTREGYTGGKARWKIVVPNPQGQASATAATRSEANDDPRDEDVPPPPPRRAAPVEAPEPITFNIKGRGPVSFPSQEAADGFRNAHPEVIE